MARQLLLASSSKCFPHGYLDHCERETCELFRNARQVLFVPYARPSGCTHDEYTGIARERFEAMGIRLMGIHETADPIAAIREAEGIFIGGGNSFVLLRDLYAFGLIQVLAQRIADGMPYMGTSAGSNVAGRSIGTSNDMPIAHPPSFDAIGAVPFNINPHFPGQKPDPKHQGETRETRISEFHFFNEQPVVALHEDGMLRIDGSTAQLIGARPAYLFRKGQEIEQIEPGELPTEIMNGR